MNIKVLIFFGVAAAVLADLTPRAYVYDPPQDSKESSMESAENRVTAKYRAPQSEEFSAEYEPAKYDFSSVVKDDYFGNDFGHQEARDDDNTEGTYYVQLPDGRLQTVKYYVDGDSGYVAEVSYEGEAQYPESHEIGRYTPSKSAYSASSSEESQENPTVAPPRRRYFAPSSEESKEASVAASPRRHYFAPSSEESKEASVASPPRRHYFAPSSEESKEASVAAPPRRHYYAPESEESQETPVYSPSPRSFYSAPKSKNSLEASPSESEESVEKPVYSPPPKSFYSASAPEESDETPIYSPPKKLYSAP